MSGPAMEEFGEVLWNGRIVEGGSLAIPGASRYGVMAVSYASHVTAGFAMHFINTDGLHQISGIAGAAASNGLSIRGFDLRSDDGVTWTAYDLKILSLWGAETDVGSQWGKEGDSNTLTIWGVVPSAVTQRVSVVS